MARIDQFFKLARIGQIFKTADVALNSIASSSIVFVYSPVCFCLSVLLSLLVCSLVFASPNVLSALARKSCLCEDRLLLNSLDEISTSNPFYCLCYPTHSKRERMNVCQSL